MNKATIRGKKASHRQWFQLRKMEVLWGKEKWLFRVAVTGLEVAMIGIHLII